jgi:hypothetical protein
MTGGRLLQAFRARTRGQVTRPTLYAFFDERTGRWTALADADGEPTPRQLRRLNRSGQLELVSAGAAKPVTKGEAAAAIDTARDRRADAVQP